MKTIYILMLAFLFFSFQEHEPVYVNSTSDAVVSLSSKDSLNNYFDETAVSLENEISGISEDQMHFKPTEESWSVSQIMEHIIATEKMLLANVKQLTSQPENVERKSEVKVSDHQLVTGIVDRTQKFKAPKELEPTGKYNSPEEALEDFRKVREEIKGYLDGFPGNMRNHISDSPAGAVDAHQSLLFIAAHTARHTEQIKENKANRGYSGI